MMKIKVRRDNEGRVLKDDAGSTLVIALVFMTVFGLLLAVVMGFIDASFRATLAVRDQTNAMYAGDAAIDAAIQYYRSQLRDGRVNRPCPTYGPISFGTEPDIYEVMVECDGMLTSGDTFIPDFDETVPEHSILTLSTDPTIPGIYVEPTDKRVKIRGDVWSRSTIEIKTGEEFLEVEGAVTAATGCVGDTADRIIATTLTCITSTVAADPNYPMSTTTVPGPPESMPSCPAADSVLKFYPGTYTSAAALNALTAAPTCGSGKIYWFQPGIYYFDFQEPENAAVWNISHPSANGAMDGISDYVAGTPRATDWNPALPTSPTNRPVFGRSCLTENDFLPPADPPSDTGVQFIFGGVSRMHITSSGEFEMCAQPSPRTGAPQQQIAIFGVTQTTGAPGLPVNPPDRDPETALSLPSTTQTVFINPLDGRVIDSKDAEAKLTSVLRNASIALGSFCPGCPPIPADATISSAKLRINHSDQFQTGGGPNPNRVAQVTATVSWNSSSIVITDGGTSLPCPAQRICRDSNEHEELIDLKALGFDSPAEINGGVSATFEGRWQANEPYLRLNGMRLEIVYTPPSTGFQQQTGTMVALNNNSFPFFQTSLPKTTIAIHGTVYAPLSGVDLFLVNRADEALKRGAIVRYIKLKATAGLISDEPPISLPEGSRGNRGILLRAIVDPPDADPRVRVRAVIDIDDGCQVLPCEVGQTVTVRSWSFVR